MTRQASNRGGAARRREVADRLHSAAIRLLRGLRKVDRLTGVGPARLSALSVLVFGGAKTLGGLAEAEQVTPATMSRVVAGLVASGLARRAPHPDDGRALRIEATARGRRLLEEGRARRIERLHERLETLDDEELEILARASETLERLGREMR